MYSSAFFVFQTRVDDGRWHKLRVMRKRQVGILQVDEERPSRGRSLAGGGGGGGASVLNTDGKVWVGGKRSLPAGLPKEYYGGFRGCVRRVRIFKRRLDLLRSGDGSSLKFCEDGG